MISCDMTENVLTYTWYWCRRVLLTGRFAIRSLGKLCDIILRAVAAMLVVTQLYQNRYNNE